ncbi:Histidinol-phosphate aminotransferase [Acaryochloris thomasi RCC1774]|uniref:Histidinol-phosphate aminotransferase n=1 Tax=Acaryochloris thomasi RCC1774 TaxID=1764569 RepID=A0A2W1JNV3_9CYAN|nr:histidinol-phosphate transaminase [Acaryochloris thomasi]PZD72552.1 Histidinol-phosphate aminotransferase [Acaryochloris thomasi RCC1774]
MLPFIRSDLAQLTAYTPHPESAEQPAQVDQLDTNECPYDLPEPLKEKLAWNYQQQISANRYPDGGHLALKQAIAAYVSETSALSCSADAISVGNGSDELIRSLLIATCLGGQGSILVAAPTFSMYGILAQTLGIPVVTVDRHDDFSMDLEAAQATVSTPINAPIRTVFVVHPNSPTGNPLTTTEIEWLKSLPEEILVVVDEAYFEFSQQTLVAEVQHRTNWIILRTFSKAFRLAAHRVGYAIATPKLTNVLEKVRLPYNLPAMSLAAAELAMSQRQELLQNIPEAISERDRLYQALAQFPSLQLWPSAANFIYLRASSAEATAKLAQDLKRQGTSIRHTGGGLRITVGSPEENQRTISRIQIALE